MAKFERLESLINSAGFDKVVKEGGENMCKITLILGEFIVMISTPKEEVEVYTVSIFQNRDVIFQDWFYNQLFVPKLKEFIKLYKNN
jgi:hypothetical protein